MNFMFMFTWMIFSWNKKATKLFEVFFSLWNKTNQLLGEFVKQLLKKQNKRSLVVIKLKLQIVEKNCVEIWLWIHY